MSSLSPRRPKSKAPCSRELSVRAPRRAQPLASDSWVEAVEPRLLFAAVRFAVIGDYGHVGQPQLDVSNRVKSWNPELVITVGDNNYPDGEASTIDANVGQYYSQFIAPYSG